MRSLLLAFFLLGLVVFPCLAEQPVVMAPTAPKLAPVVVETKIALGEVKSVTLADSVKGTKSEIAIVDKSGTEPKEYTFLVKSTTTIYDANWQAIGLDKIVKDEKAKVKYLVTKEGVNEAISVTLRK